MFNYRKVILILIFIHTFIIFADYESKFDLNLSASSELYLQSNKDSINWEYNYLKRKPMVNLGMDFTFFNLINTVVDIPITKDRLVTENDTENITNIITNINDFDMNFPTKAYVSLNYKTLYISTGRDLLKIGEGLILDKNTFYHDYLQYGIGYNYFFYNYTLVNLNETSFNESDVRYQDLKNFVAHEFGFKYKDIVKLSIIESMVLQDMELDLRLFNPFTFMHNEYLSVSDMANAFSSAHLVYTPVDRFKFFAEFGVDQYATSYESGRWEQEEPNAIGWITGFESLIPVLSYNLGVSFKYIHTDPYLGLDSSGINFTSTKNYITHSQGAEDDANGIPITDYLGVGGDLDSYKISIALPEFYKINIGLGYELRLKGEVTPTTVLESYNSEAINAKTPSGNGDIYNIITLKGEYTFNEWLHLFGQYNYINKDSITDNQFILSLTYSL